VFLLDVEVRIILYIFIATMMYNHSPVTTFSVFSTRANRRDAATAAVDDAHFTSPVHIHHIICIYDNIIMYNRFTNWKRLGKRTLVNFFLKENSFLLGI